MTAAFTPGPWEVCHAGTGKSGKFEIDEYYVSTPGADVAICADIVDPATGKISEANARLIAAAPHLLSALELIAEQTSEGADSTGTIGWLGAIARAAIAKATGAA